MTTYYSIFDDFTDITKYLYFIIQRRPTDAELKLVFKKYIENYKKVLELYDFNENQMKIS